MKTSVVIVLSLLMGCEAGPQNAGPQLSPATQPLYREDRFRLTRQAGRWWLISPANKQFVALSVVHVASAYHGTESLLHTRFGGDEEKANAYILDLLKQLNCNSIGYDAPDELKPHIPYFAFCQPLSITEWIAPAQRKFADVFDPAVEEQMRANVRLVCERNRENPNLIGYYWTDMPLWDMVRAERTIGQNWVQHIRELPRGSAGKQAYVDFLLARYKDRLDALATRYEVAADRAAMLDHTFRTAARLDSVVIGDDRAFLRLIARRYYFILGSETRACDPHHLIFGDRYTNYAHPDEVIEEALPWIDVLSVQPNGAFDRSYFDKLHAQTGKPINICDHQVSFPVPGFNKVIWPPADSKQVAMAQMDSFVRDAFDRPYVIGYGRCQLIDQINPGRRIKIGLLDKSGDPKQDLCAHLASAYLEVKRKLGL